MRFPSSPTRTFKDVQDNFDYLIRKIGKGIFTLGINSVQAITGLSIDFGTGTVVWPGASPFSTALAVNHGIGRIPIAVVVSDGGGGTLGQIAPFSATPASTTQFAVAAQATVAPAAGITRTFYWIAIG